MEKSYALYLWCSLYDVRLSSPDLRFLTEIKTELSVSLRDLHHHLRSTIYFYIYTARSCQIQIDFTVAPSSAYFKNYARFRHMDTWKRRYVLIAS